VGRLLGLPVVKIIRLRIGALRLGNLKPRQWRHLTADEIAELKGEAKTFKPAIRHTRRPDQKKPLNPKDKPKRPLPKRTTGKSPRKPSS
jgi:23S rRNA pseudouridine2605 synthase